MPNSVVYLTTVMKSLIKYTYYGFKQRLRALFKRELGIFEFFKSLFRIPVEAYVFSSIELRAMGDCPNVC